MDGIMRLHAIPVKGGVYCPVPGRWRNVAKFATFAHQTKTVAHDARTRESIAAPGLWSYGMRNDDNESDFGLFIAAWFGAVLFLVAAMALLVSVLK